MAKSLFSWVPVPVFVRCLLQYQISYQNLACLMVMPNLLKVMHINSHQFCVYFTIRSFFTSVTPETCFATSPAFVTLCAESTKPVNCTTPLNVFTSICKDFSICSSRSPDFILAVMAASSILLSFFYIDILSPVQCKWQVTCPKAALGFVNEMC